MRGFSPRQSSEQEIKKMTKEFELVTSNGKVELTIKADNKEQALETLRQIWIYNSQTDEKLLSRLREKVNA